MSRYLAATLSPAFGFPRSLAACHCLRTPPPRRAPTTAASPGTGHPRPAEMAVLGRGRSISASAASGGGSAWPASPREALEVHQFWFNGKPDENNPKLWWGGGAEVDEEVKSRFGKLVEQAVAGRLGPEWETNPTSTCAKVILCDQFTRQTARGSPDSFAGDKEAQRLALKISGDPAYLDSLTCYERIFSVVLPCMHSENLEHHELAQGLLERWTAEATEESHLQAYRGTGGALTEHTEVLRQFGRYPSRNAALGRETTAEEEHHLRTNPKAWEVKQSKS